MATSSCTDAQGSDCDDENSEHWALAILYVYISGVAGVGVPVSIVTFAGEYGRWSESVTTARTCTRNIIVKLLLGCGLSLIWPLLFSFAVVWLVPRKLYRRAARRVRRRQPGEDTVDVRQRVKIWSPGKWQHRGWIVMMRARHQRSLIRASKRWLPRPTFLRPKQRQLAARGVVTSEFESASRSRAGESGIRALSEIELVEAGRSDHNFARVVTAVVEMEEEGLFRSIITYI